ncbi:hypothetical protein FB562_0804 [Homoserinimonas aerilata]|uniref:Uncharacterized protein n=1 Tax=Homoserinimonas aerilata TaxID=1162970 RepID=A0A542YI13_9MICO|nr:hypothetical protein [Homoserinimonas aerilata]TQL47736.1 hypothetical protein FB562_0804 [Homoserinimonas aerilata]
MTNVSVVPEIMPVLSAGRHRRPRQGACFMEFASYLAGERWSDHPQCTHPLLAFLARGVNDFTGDDGRQRLAPLIPSVIGLTGSDPRLDVVLALRAATTALPVVAESRQRALASGVISCERMLEALGGASEEEREMVRGVSRDTPLAWEWAQGFCRDLTPRSTLSFTRQGRAIVSTAVLGVAQACIDDPDAVLYEMLRASVDDCLRVLGRLPSPEVEVVSILSR